MKTDLDRLGPSSLPLMRRAQREADVTAERQIGLEVYAFDGEQLKNMADSMNSAWIHNLLTSSDPEPKMSRSNGMAATMSMRNQPLK